MRVGEDEVDGLVGDALVEFPQVRDPDAAVDGDRLLVSFEEEHVEPAALGDLIAARCEIVDGIPVLGFHRKAFLLEG